MLGLSVPATPLHTLRGVHGYFGADLPNQAVFRLSVNRPENTRAYRGMDGVGFRVRGIRI